MKIEWFDIQAVDDSLSYKMSMQCEDEDHEEPGAIMISREIEL